jgi:cob(I)alamin adenosyltransferase
VTKRTRIYTRAGDTGQTGLVGGQRVGKDSLRISCFGDVDECSCAIGAARSALRTDGALDERAAALDGWLAWTQDMLFNVGSDLATPPDKRSDAAPHIAERDVAALEAAIDAVSDELPALDAFIHAGGSQAGAWLHLARAMCRRAERHIVLLGRSEPVEPVVVKFVNRLSDALFEWARWINYARGVAEARWNPASRPPGVS